MHTNTSVARAGTDRKHTYTISVFHQLGPLGRVGLVVDMSVCVCVCPLFVYEPHLQNLLGPGNNRKYLVPKAGDVVGSFRVRCLKVVCVRPWNLELITKPGRMEHLLSKLMVV